MNNYEQASAWVAALTGSPDTPMEWRGLHDTNKAVPGRTRRTTLAEAWQELNAWQAEGFGIFAMISETDGLGRELQNITSHRAHFVELDEDAATNLQRVNAWHYAPHLIVESSAGKYHGYLFVKPYGPAADRFRALQNKLVVEFGSDPNAKDAARVLRVPGFYNLKYPDRVPHLVHCWTGPAWGKDRYEIGALEVALAHVKAPMGGGGGRKPLGDPALAAPSKEWIKAALDRIDPNVGRDLWIKYTAAIKQAGIGCGMDEAEIRALWDEWCLRYVGNDVGENNKQWNSIGNSAAGWPMLLNASGLKAAAMFGSGPATPAMPSSGITPMPAVHSGATITTQPVVAYGGAMPNKSKFDLFLDEQAQAQYFAGCILIVREGKIRIPTGRYLDVGKFNAAYGGKQFKIKSDGSGMFTDEAWKAATRGQLFQIPSVDHVRFLPASQPGAFITDELGRQGLNTYVPAHIDMIAGDAAPFLRHLRAILKTEADVTILLNYLARIVQSPGVKIPWAPVIQGAEGLGKNVIKLVMSHAVGRVYRYFPKATELAETGGKFNGWMRERLLIICDEVKTDDKRNLIEALKDLVSEEEVQIQSKGVDQDVEDNPANWLFFTNWKSAIPIERNSRRWCIFYSTMQTADDLIAAGMNSTYFAALYDWIKGDGKRIVAHYLKHFPIDPAYDPAIHQRAPQTSSTQDALIASRTGPEHVFFEAVETNRAGFRDGWVSTKAFAMAIKEAGLSPVLPASMSRILEALGYARIGRAPVRLVHEDMAQPVLYSRLSGADVANYAEAQGYGSGAPTPPPGAIAE